MDQGSETPTANSLIISGVGCAVGMPCPSERYLKTPKSRKFMGKQDHLAVCAAGRALESAGLNSTALGPKAGLFLAVGFIPFERSDIDALIAGSMEGGRISLRRFGTDGFSAINPLLTFRCLPNMPAYHVSACFDIQGEYFVTYPGPGQFYNALDEAVNELASGRISIALIGAVADQTNFLVSHHYGRLRPVVSSQNLRDSAGFLVLERAGENAARGGPVRGKLKDLKISYTPHNPFNTELDCLENFVGCPTPNGYFGAASLPIVLAKANQGCLQHELRARDGISAWSTWEVA